MEKLKTYLTGKRKSDFAKAVGISPVYLSNLQSGLRRPSFDLMVLIERETGGDVSLYDWVTY